MKKITNFIKETYTEMKNVKWPTRRQAIGFTLAVIIISVVIAYLLGFFDYVFKTGLEQIINK